MFQFNINNNYTDKIQKNNNSKLYFVYENNKLKVLQVNKEEKKDFYYKGIFYDKCYIQTKYSYNLDGIDYICDTNYKSVIDMVLDNRNFNLHLNSAVSSGFVEWGNNIQDKGFYLSNKYLNIGIAVCSVKKIITEKSTFIDDYFMIINNTDDLYNEYDYMNYIPNPLVENDDSKIYNIDRTHVINLNTLISEQNQNIEIINKKNKKKIIMYDKSNNIIDNQKCSDDEFLFNISTNAPILNTDINKILFSSCINTIDLIIRDNTVEIKNLRSSISTTDKFKFCNEINSISEKIKSFIKKYLNYTANIIFIKNDVFNSYLIKFKTLYKNIDNIKFCFSYDESIDDFIYYEIDQNFIE